MQTQYDIIIMGGGSSGPILGALLQKKSNLNIAIFEQEKFPRNKIGKSFTHPIIPILEEAGVLQKIVTSKCWIKKYGGIFDWDHTSPRTTFFDMQNYLEDQVYRWAIHTDRAEFDKILLDHAKELGVSVFEEKKITTYRPNSGNRYVKLKSGEKINCSIFVDASGRKNNVILSAIKSFLSNYKNLTAWIHITSGKPAEDLEGNWNIFRKDQLSPIACFAFEHGWVWYIPIPKIINNKHTTVHSLGIVTDPKLVRSLGKNLNKPKELFEFVKTIPMLHELIKDAKPISDETKIVSNYSMIQDKFCDLNEGWIMVGDSTYFVDPLFSSGVAFAGGMASTASLLIRETIENQKLTLEAKNDIWYDYDQEWHKIAHSFALSIDQWYYAIAKHNPQSVFWNNRNMLSSDLGIKDEKFNALVDTSLNQDLLTILTSGSLKKEDLDTKGKFLRKPSELNKCEPQPEDQISLHDGIYIREGYSINVPGFKASIPPMNISKEEKEAIATYWKDPLLNSDAVPSETNKLISCCRFTKRGLHKNKEVSFISHKTNGKALYSLLKGNTRAYQELEKK
ncbi:NAD(P)/FAD-dependent oxidoreductase [Aquimarina sp. I32.4]|uniref:NAD(P)/FAD-dependent oxidoreductase n=1 Tax=Aquimarina sp. I32.4 TaxID=2053903 RepID=UPI000CDEADD3|nr:tryptophan 7-halogenase [Aquimarina sp. I32.4]